MNYLIVYFSYSGNTRKVAGVLGDFLSKEGKVDTLELKDLAETGNFFKQGESAFKHKRADIGNVNFDLSSYDSVCFGTPVWAFTTTPAMNTFLDKCTGMEGKGAILFTTSGGAGDKRCIKYMQEALAKKGAKGFRSFSVARNKIKDKEFILSKIKEAMRLWPNG